MRTGVDGTEGRNQHQDLQQRRQAHQEFEDPRDDDVQPPALVGRHKAEQTAGRVGDRDRDDRNRDDAPAAPQESAEHVAPEMIGAEPMLDGGRPIGRRQTDLGRRIGRQEWTDRDQRQHDGDEGKSGTAITRRQHSNPLRALPHGRDVFQGDRVTFSVPSATMQAAAADSARG